MVVDAERRLLLRAITSNASAASYRAARDLGPLSWTLVDYAAARSKVIGDV